ncbi:MULTISPECIES: SGNH/GDSL hydrolase family protein [Acinetobacter]|uniref:SGNH/GDSL hydrolase family protein n=1 Tax=Acinetobacter TaxID=469 RepID=UPI000EA15D2F|nr:MULTISPECIES: SGNH/GDSL hydrolase family protein [Acinetobacter]RKG45164.1 SGNH/GDSL hydrolase family protein [Acinetobacter cumulans]RZG60097.1 SGNH/GDSL hydrolase family protein [Acinetobacter sp. WCHAc060006]
MAVSEQVPYIEHIGNGVTTSFALEFDCDNQDHLIVLVDDVEPVVGAWSLNGGAVIFGTAPEDGKKITIQRNTPFSRNTDYQSYNNSFRPQSVNGDFDRVWYKIQELGVKDWLLDLKIQKFRDDVNLTALEDTLIQAQELRDSTAGLADEVLGNTTQSQTLLADTTAQANAAALSATSANSSKDLAKQYADNIDASLTAIAGGHKAYQTLAAAQAAQATLPLNNIVEVTNDGENNGTYQWNGTTLTKSAYDPLAQAKNYADSKEQTTYDAVGKAPVVRNLFDMSRASAGSAIDANGAIYTSASNSASDFIEILSGQGYKFSITVGTVAFYTKGKAYISQTALAADTTVTTPSNAFYLRFHQATATLSKQMLIKGTSLPASYIAFGYVDPATAKRNELTNARAVIDNAVPRGVNLFDKSRALQNYAMGGTGIPYAISAWFVADFIAVKCGESYISNKPSGNNGGAEYDENGNFLRLFTVTANTSFTTSSDAFYVRFQVNNLSNLDSLMLVKGSSLPTSYVAFASLQGLQDSMTVISKSFDAIGLKQASRPNLFDLRTGQDNWALSNVNGGGYAATNNFTTGVIPVVVGQNIFITAHYPLVNNVVIVFRNGSTFVSSVQAPLDSSFTVPSNVDGMQISLSMLRRRYSLHVSIGTTKPAGYRPYLLTGDKPNQDAQIVLLGDSFTDQSATAGGWQPYFINQTGSTIIANFAKSGRQVKDALKSADGSRNLTADDFANATHVVIPLGTNDYGAHRPLGTIADAVDETTANTFYADVYKVLWQLFTWKPTLRVMWATPTIRSQFVTVPAQPFYPAANSAGATLQQYRQAIIEVCALFGVRVADQFANSGFNLINILSVTDDGLHPNMSVGQPLYGRTLAASFNLL